MVSICGIILVERNDISIRIYEVTRKKWKLVHYENFPLMLRSAPAVHQESLAQEITTVLSNFLTTDKAQYVTRWKAGARDISQATVNLISASIGLEVDYFTVAREQELLCKGLFTELW